MGREGGEGKREREREGKQQTWKQGWEKNIAVGWDWGGEDVTGRKKIQIYCSDATNHIKSHLSIFIL